MGLVAGILIVVHMALPPFWGNPGLSEKVSFVKRNGHAYDRLFLGSSHIYRQLSPALFDSALHDGSRSFNMGYAATFSPEAELACGYLLAQPALAVKEMYVEVSPFMEFKGKNLSSARAWYMVSPTVWWLLFNHARELGIGSDQNRWTLMKGVSEACVKAGLTLGLFDQLSKLEVRSSALVFGPRGDGFMPLEEEMRLSFTNDLDRRVTELERDTLLIQQRMEQVRGYYSSMADLHVSKPHLDMLMHLMELGDRKGVKVYFILPPLISSPEALAVFMALPEERRIDLCDPAKFPEFYLAANAFDKGHLNDRGSRLFTAALANEVKRMHAARNRQP